MPPWEGGAWGAPSTGPDHSICPRTLGWSWNQGSSGGCIPDGTHSAPQQRAGGGGGGATGGAANPVRTAGVYMTPGGETQAWPHRASLCRVTGLGGQLCGCRWRLQAADVLLGAQKARIHWNKSADPWHQSGLALSAPLAPRRPRHITSLLPCGCRGRTRVTSAELSPVCSPQCPTTVRTGAPGTQTYRTRPNGGLEPSGKRPLRLHGRGLCWPALQGKGGHRAAQRAPVKAGGKADRKQAAAVTEPLQPQPELQRYGWCGTGSYCGRGVRGRGTTPPPLQACVCGKDGKCP